MPVYCLLKLITSNKLRTQQASTGTRSESPRDVEIVDHSPSLLLRVPSSGSVSHSPCVASSSPSVSHTPSSLLSPRPDPFFVSPLLAFVTVRFYPAPSLSASARLRHRAFPSSAFFDSPRPSAHLRSQRLLRQHRLSVTRPIAPQKDKESAKQPKTNNVLKRKPFRRLSTRQQGKVSKKQAKTAIYKQQPKDVIQAGRRNRRARFKVNE